MDQFIVAEITKNWTNTSPIKKLISQEFEGVININNERGYQLKEWKYHVSYNEGVMTETIIAIFELKN